MDSTRYVMLNKKKPFYGPMAQSIFESGYEVRYFGDNIPDGSSVVMFHKKPEDLPKINGKVGQWMCDYRQPEETGWGQNMDAIFLCNTELKEEYEKKFGVPVYYMPQVGCDVPIKKGRQVKSDIVFIGNFAHKYHYNRLDIIKRLKEFFDVEIITGEQNTEDQQWVYNSAPFSLAISPQATHYTSNRLYSILSSGGFYLTLWFPGIEDLFENHKHLVWFKTADEAVELVDYYYEHPEEYDKIREEGLNLYKRKHTAKHRLDNMFDILEGKTEEFYGFR